MSPTSADALGIQLPEYVGRQMKLRWWFPEHAYKNVGRRIPGRVPGGPRSAEFVPTMVANARRAACSQRIV